MTNRSVFTKIPLAAWMILGWLAPIGLAQDMVSRLPATSNAGAVVDVKGLLNSKLGQKEAWQGKLMGGYSSRPLAVPAYANYLTLAAFLELPECSPMWQLAYIDTSVAVDLSKVAQEQKGVADKIMGRSAVATQFGILHVAATDKEIATIWPAQRQLAAWLLGKHGDARGPSDYLKNALKTAPGQPIAMALDLNEAFSGASIRKAMAMGGLASLDQSDEFIKLSGALAGVNGVTVKVMVDDAIKISMAADFDAPVALPPSAVKPFCMELIGSLGIDTAGFADLDYRVSGKQIVATGDASAAMVRGLLGLLVPDTTSASLDKAVAAAEGGSPPPQPDKPANPAAAATLEYYKAVSAILDRLTAGTSMVDNAARLRADAKKIQQLPVMNVDGELLGWGMATVERMNQCATILAQGQLSAQNAAANVESPVGDASYSESGFESSSDTAESRAAFRNAQRQRRQAAQTARQSAIDQVVQVLNTAAGERQKLRITLTQKYGVEF